MIIISFLSVKMQNITASNCAIIDQRNLSNDLSKKHRLVIYQTQWTAKLRKDSSLIFCLELTANPNPIELAS